MNRRLRSFLLKLVLLAGSSLFAIVVLEGSIRGLNLFEPARAAARTPDTEPVLHSQTVGHAVVHPFLGWTNVPRPWTERSFLLGTGIFPDRNPSRWAVENSRINEFGYRSAYDDYRDLGDGAYVVGLFGGSLAAQLAMAAGDHLRDSLERRFPSLKGRVVVLNLGGGGYKQPQQVNTLTEMLLLGVKLDLILNVDGFNEVVFGAWNAKKSGVHPFFPSATHYREFMALMTGRMTPERIELVAAVLREKEEAAALVKAATTSPVLRRSEAFAALAGALVTRHRQRALELERRLQDTTEVSDSELPVARLDDPCMGDGDCFNLIADMWAEGSRLLHGMASEHGVPYVHFLQPNQYVPGSKVLTEEEKKTAYLDRSIFSKTIPLGYPLLLARGRELRKEGISFYDLTGMFRDSNETLYSDNCCHLNIVGYRRLATRIVRLLPDLEGKR